MLYFVLTKRRFSRHAYATWLAVLCNIQSTGTVVYAPGLKRFVWGILRVVSVIFPVSRLRFDKHLLDSSMLTST